jgi:hypothetical protein
VNVFGELPVEDVTHHVVECRSLQHVRQRTRSCSSLTCSVPLMHSL